MSRALRSRLSSVGSGGDGSSSAASKTGTLSRMGTMRSSMKDLMSSRLVRSNTASRVEANRVAADAASSSNPPAPETTRPQNEVIIVKLSVRDASKDRDGILTVTNRAVYNSSGATHEILDIHSIKTDPNHPHALYISWFKSKQKIASSKVIGAMRSGIHAGQLLVMRRFVCDSLADQETLLLCLENLLRGSWQNLCETGPNAIILAPEIYQMHSHVVKLNRKGQGQERVLIVSNLWVYNAEVTHCSTAIKSVKWALPIKALIFLRLSMLQKSPAMTMRLDESIVSIMFDKRHRFGRTELPKTNVSFCLSSGRQVDQLVCELRRIYRDITSRELQIEQSHDFAPTVIDDEVTLVSRDDNAVKGFLLKYRKNMKGKPHRRFVKLAPSGVLQWAESPNSPKFLTGEIQKLCEGFPDDKDIDRAFIVQTTSKMLYLIADNGDDYFMWINAIKKILLKTHARS